jgi:hypothetical protein
MIWLGDRCECGGVFDRTKVFRAGAVEQFVCACSGCKRLITREGRVSPYFEKAAVEAFKKP